MCFSFFSVHHLLMRPYLFLRPIHRYLLLSAIGAVHFPLVFLSFFSDFIHSFDGRAGWSHFLYIYVFFDYHYYSHDFIFLFCLNESLDVGFVAAFLRVVGAMGGWMGVLLDARDILSIYIFCTIIERNKTNLQKDKTKESTIISTSRNKNNITITSEMEGPTWIRSTK